MNEKIDIKSKVIEKLGIEKIKEIEEKTSKSLDEIIDLILNAWDLIRDLIQTFDEHKEFLEERYNTTINDSEDFKYYLGKYSRELEDEKDYIDTLLNMMEV